MAAKDTRGRCRSRSASGSRDNVYGSDYKRRKSSPACSSRSNVSNPCSSTASSGKSQTENVSYWMRQRAEKMGIFYATEATDITEFYKISEKWEVEESIIYPFTGKNKQILDSLVKFIKEKLKRTTELNDPVTEGLARSLRNIKLCEKMLEDTENSVIDEPDQNLKWYLSRSLMKIEEFYVELLSFLRKQSFRPKQIAETDFTKLLSKFLEICLLNVDILPDKRVMEINGVPTASVPDLLIKFHQELVIGVVEVKGMRLKKGPSDKKFSIQGVLNDRVLGQHAGELLVDHKESLFGVEAVLGILCMQTTIVFTLLEVSKDHLKRIVEDGEVEQKKQMKRKVGEDDAKNSGIILYTKPYDYMKEEDREEVIEFLVWLGLQTIPGTHRLQKEKISKKPSIL
ncbi:uncharacterized protein LOC111108463 isoform X3 [Crassostrea virginica]